MTRQQMIQALTRYELEWFANHPELIDDSVQFFAAGGFADYSDLKLRVALRAYALRRAYALNGVTA